MSQTALRDGRLIKVFAFRGATQLVTPEDGGIYLALRAASRMWELPSWQSYYGLEPSDWPSFRAVVREALGEGPLTYKELGSAVTADARFRHLQFAFDDKAWTLLKPLMWQGDMCFGPTARPDNIPADWTPIRGGEGSRTLKKRGRVPLRLTSRCMAPRRSRKYTTGW